MAEEEIELAAPEKKSRKGLVIILLAVVLVLGGGTVGALYALGMLGGGASPARAEGEAVEETQAKAQAMYVPLDPAFTVNFRGGAGARFLQVSVQAMTREPGIDEHIKRHMPVIRNDLTLLFSSKSARELSTLEGKEALRAEALTSIQKVLEAEVGSKGVEAVYFTSFVMQ